VLSVLLALLELAKLGELRLSQTRAFGAFDITRDPASEAA
jgi:segregation and condensation protein A